MIACFDVHYHDDGTATAAAVLIHAWEDEEPVESFTTLVRDVGDYEAGQFYQRELKPLLAVMALLPTGIHTVVIDAYVQLNASGDPGLGAYLHQHLPPAFETCNIIGVAKNRFRDSQHAAEVLRGDSQRPLFVTALGCTNTEAGDLIVKMHGRFRIPTILKTVDQRCRHPSNT